MKTLARKEIFYGFLVIFFSLIPLSPASHFNGVIIFIVFAFLLKGMSDRPVCSPKIYVLVVLVLASLQVLVGYYAWKEELANVATVYMIPEVSVWWLLLERPINLIILAGVFYYFFELLHFDFNLTNVLLFIAAVVYSYSFLLEFILRWNYNVPFHRFLDPWGYFETILKNYYSGLDSFAEKNGNNLVNQETFKAVLSKTTSFLIQQVNSLVVLMNLLYATFLIKIFSFRMTIKSKLNLSQIDEIEGSEVVANEEKFFQFSSIRFPEKIVIFFLLGWMSFLLPDSFVEEMSIEFLQHAMMGLTAVLSCLYFFQGLGVMSHFVKRKLLNKAPAIARIWKIWIITFCLILFFLQSGYFISLLVLMGFIIGLLDQWINYRKI